jgi:hypothetical protein
MDVILKKRAKIVAINEHTSKNIRDIACSFGVGKPSVSRIPYTYKDSGSIFPERKGKCGRRLKRTLYCQHLLRNGRLHPTMRSKHLQRDLLVSGTDIYISLYGVGHLNLSGRQEEKKKKKKFFDNCYEAGYVDMGKKVQIVDN